MDIVIDFDGTCVAHEFPQIGRNIGAQEVLIDLIRAGHRLILSTMRSDISEAESELPEIHCKPGPYLTDALEWFKVQGIELYGIQVNPAQSKWTKSPKAYGHLYIDDAALGIPLVHPEKGRPYVYWNEVRMMLEKKGLLNVAERTAQNVRYVEKS
jgi:hypothetical protein